MVKGCGWTANSEQLNYVDGPVGDDGCCGWTANSEQLNFILLHVDLKGGCGWTANSEQLNWILPQTLEKPMACGVSS